MDPSPVEPSDETTLLVASWEKLKQRLQLSHAQIPDPQKLRDNACVFLSPYICDNLLYSNRELTQSPKELREKTQLQLLTSKSDFWPVEPESPGLIQAMIFKKLFPHVDGAQLRLRSPAQDTAVGKQSPVIVGSLGTLPHTSPQCVVIWAFWLLIPGLLLLFSRQVVSDSFVTWWTVAHQAPLSMGFFQAAILEWVAISFFRGFSWLRDRTCISCLGRWILSYWVTREAPFLGLAGG